MAYWPIWYFLILGISLAVVSLPVFRAADIPPNPRHKRLKSLDGLRGLLATSVFIHHAAINYGLVRTGVWNLPPSGLYILAGQGAVGMFFMVTGFLFWSRIINEHGRPNWPKLYIGRFFRIVPVYATVITAALLAVFAFSGFHLFVSLSVLLKSIGRWLSVGVLGPRPVNGDWRIKAEMSMTWTLRSEWFFYASLPLTALLVRFRLGHRWIIPALFLLGLCIVSFGNQTGQAVLTQATLFLCGMTTATLMSRGVVKRLGDRNYSSVLLLAAFVLVAVFGKSGYSAFSVALLSAAFLLILSGASLFGFLTSRPARRLGDASYCLYLVHGVILYIAFEIAPILRFAQQSVTTYWFTIGCIAVIVVAISVALHEWVERRGIEAGITAVCLIERARHSRIVGTRSVIASQEY